MAASIRVSGREVGCMAMEFSRGQMVGSTKVSMWKTGKRAPVSFNGPMVATTVVNGEPTDSMAQGASARAFYAPVSGEMVPSYAGFPSCLSLPEIYDVLQTLFL